MQCIFFLLPQNKSYNESGYVQNLIPLLCINVHTDNLLVEVTSF